MRQHKTILILVLTVMSASLFAQMTIRAVGMGGAYTAAARGVHAVSWNPANLGLSDNPGYSMSIISTAVGLNNNSFTRGDVYKYEGKTWSEQDKRDILSKIPDNGLAFTTSVSVRTLSFSVKNFAFCIDADVDALGKIDKSVFDLLLQGNELNRDYLFNEMDARGAGVGTASFSWGQPVAVDWAEAFSIGGTFKLVYGVGKARVETANAKLNIGDYGFTLNSNYEAKYALGGMGWGFDVGAAAQINKKWSAGFGMLNLVGTIPWKKEAESAMGYIDGTDISIEDMFADEEDNELVEDSSWTVEGLGFTERLPMVWHIGGMYREGKYLITADYTQGFRNGILSSTTPQIAIGTEWQGVSWLPLRMGMAIGGKIGWGTSFGFGIRPGGFVLDFGWMSRGFLFPGGSKGGVLGLEMGVNL